MTEEEFQCVIFDKNVKFQFINSNNSTIYIYMYTILLLFYSIVQFFHNKIVIEKNCIFFLPTRRDRQKCKKHKEGFLHGYFSLYNEAIQAEDQSNLERKVFTRRLYCITKEGRQRRHFCSLFDPRADSGTDRVYFIRATQIFIC